MVFFPKTKLSINIDHIATLRNARGDDYPNIISAIEIIKNAGADSITFHLREDRRHIKDQDVKEIKEAMLLPLNFEAAPTAEMIAIIKEIKPEQVTFVPEKRQELTTESGLDVKANSKYLGQIVNELKENNIKTAFFIDPELEQVDAAKEIDADLIEIHTGPYSESYSKAEESNQLMRLNKAINHAKKINLTCNAGHGLNFTNIVKVIEIGNINEVSIGHFAISASIYSGLENVVKQFKTIIENITPFSIK